ncbi:MAG: ribonuclease domain-containing protein [Burkholderiales bacterium]
MRAPAALASLAFAALAAFAAPAGLAQFAPSPAQPEIPAVELPKEAIETLGRIRKGGPFPYAKDGAVFGNREGRLPKRKRGYYREYTVKTPGERTRGARRIVAGRAGDLWYTEDHYASFRRIRE